MARRHERNCNRNRDPDPGAGHDCDHGHGHDADSDPDPKPKSNLDPDADPNLIARRVPLKGPTQLLQEHGEGTLLGGFLTAQGEVDLGRVRG